MYKGDKSPSGVIGSGSTADAARWEFETGELLKGTVHLNNKLPQLTNALENWLNKNQTVSQGDIHAAKEILNDLKKAQQGKLND